MFTGIITSVGTVATRNDGRITITCDYEAETIANGASIACDGCCLTATKIWREGGRTQFAVDVSNETLSRTTLGDWRPGRHVNLERSLRAGDELGGHLVTGHVDGVARIASITSDGNALRFRFEVPQSLARFIAPKGSVALDGTSLTVNEVEAGVFGVAIIPHTLTATGWTHRQSGDSVNIEVDLIARYVARLRDTEGPR